MLDRVMTKTMEKIRSSILARRENPDAKMARLLY
jgi:hypothetical protein